MSNLLRPITAAALAIGGLLHLVLYVDAGYDAVPDAVVRLGFPAQAVASVVVAVALLIDRTRRSALVAALVAGGSLLAFVASRTVGLLGFSESGIEPTPETPILLVAEVIALVGASAMLLRPEEQPTTVTTAARVRDLAVVAAVTIVAVGIGALAGDDTTTAPDIADDGQIVDISGFAFGDGVIEAEPGSTITFVNRDGAPHTVDAVDGSFASGTLGTGDTFALRVGESGVVEIFCAIHPSMVATVVAG